jgi:putative endonuclease
MDDSQRFVYLLRSTQHPDQHYVGMTFDPTHRLAARDDNHSSGTAAGHAWRLVVMIEFDDARRARAFERYLKSTSGREFSNNHFR